MSRPSAETAERARGAGKTAERITQGSPADNYIFQRSFFAYREACGMIGGRVLELGTGTGYGLGLLAANAEHVITVDKLKAYEGELPPNVEFVQAVMPPLRPIADASVDFVVSFQVIEHIRDDHAFLQEIRRVLKPGGRCILTTPNRKRSLSRNPFHVREYTVAEWTALLGTYFTIEKPYGVFGSARVEEYIKENKASVERFRRFDPLGLEYRLPGWMLRIPYNWLNRMNRTKLAEATPGVAAAIDRSDFELREANDDCLDVFFVGRKPLA